MYLRKIIPTLALVIVALPGIAAEEKQTPTDAFRGQTQHQMLMCQTEEKIAVNKAELGEEGGIAKVGSCIKNAKVEAKKAFGPALKVVAKNREATKLLKDYYAAWITAINGIIPGASETKGGYSRRQAAAEEKYDAIWNRFEVEAGL
jgi:hypothetical protein